jgi:hypothetical protein
MLLAKDIFSDEQCYSSPVIGLSPKDCARYSLARVYRSLERNEQPRDGLEKEASDEVAKRGGGLLTGFAIPFDVLAADRGRRDMQVNVFGQGGAMVGTEIASPVELLRNSITALRLGAQIWTGLRSNIGVPRQTAAGAISSLSEIAQAQVSDPTLDQPLLQPKRVSAKRIYSRQLLAQSSPSIEGFLRQDLFDGFAVKLDYLMYNGAGSNSEPLGIINTPGVGAVQFGGTATWQKVLAFELALAQANAEKSDARIAFVTTPSVRNAWKSTAINLAGATTVSSKQLWEAGTWNDGSTDGIVNQYRAATTNQILNNQVIFGNFKELILAMWTDGISVTNDIFTKADTGEVVITGIAFVDVLLRHAQSFCVSSDAGNQ